MFQRQGCSAGQEAGAVILVCAQGPSGVGIGTRPEAPAASGLSTDSGTGSCTTIVASSGTVRPQPIQPTAPPAVADAIVGTVAITDVVTPARPAGTSVPPIVPGLAVVTLAGGSALLLNERKKRPCGPEPADPCGALLDAVEKAKAAMNLANAALAAAQAAANAAEDKLRGLGGLDSAYVDALEQYVAAMGSYCADLEASIAELQDLIPSSGASGPAQHPGEQRERHHASAMDPDELAEDLAAAWNDLISASDLLNYAQAALSAIQAAARDLQAAKDALGKAQAAAGKAEQAFKDAQAKWAECNAAFIAALTAWRQCMAAGGG